MTMVGRYELLVRLAVGGMGELYVARARGAGGFEKRFAVKRILPHLADDKQFRAMFISEGRIAAQLSHPNVCQVVELGEDGGELFLAMEYLDGLPWSDVPRPSLDVVAGVVAQACDGLHHAHERGVVHRDVTPGNLFVTRDGVCKLLDFGIAKVAGGPATRIGVLKGKRSHLSPEQVRGEPIDARSDVFQLGIVLWEGVAGRSLFNTGGLESDIFRRILAADVPPLGGPIDAVIAKALARDPRDRFASARAMGAAVRPFAADAAAIADVVTTRCAGQLASRERRIAGEVEDPGASASVGLRGDAVPIAARPRRWRFAVLALAAAAALAIAWARCGGAQTRITDPGAGDSRGAADARAGIDADVSRGAADAGANKPDATVADPRPDRRKTTDAGVAAPRPPSIDAGVARQPGTYSVDSRPYATIYIDDRRVGDTPLFRVAVAAGPHRVRAVRQDGREQTFQIAIQPGQPTSSGQLHW